MSGWCDSPAPVVELPFKSAIEDREPAPGLGVEILIVQMERRGVALALPLVAAPELKESLDPPRQLPRVGLGQQGRSRGGRLPVAGGQGGAGADPGGAGPFQPLEPVEQERLVDAGDRRQAATR